MTFSRARMLWAEGSSIFSRVQTCSKLFSLPVSFCVAQHLSASPFLPSRLVHA